MNHLEAILVLTCLLSVGSVCAFINPPVKCPKELFHQKIICEPGQALSTLTWDEKIPNCRQFHPTCKNATSSCFEHCEWSASCQTNATVTIEMEYVRGIEIGYQMMEEKQTVAFLCCHSEDLKTGILDCDGKPSVLDGHSEPKLFSIMVQAMANDFLGNLPIKATYCPVLNIPTCPPDKIQTNLEGGSFPVPGGTTGGAGAGGGLTLQSCFGPSGLLPGVGFGCYGMEDSSNRVVPTPSACRAMCNADPSCHVACHGQAGHHCRLCGSGYGGVRSTPEPNCISYIKCVTLSDYYALNRLKARG